jgi:hypothetical protein
MVTLPGGVTARCNPVSAPRGCLDGALENVTGEQPVGGKRLLLRDAEGNAARRKIIATAADQLIETPLPGSADDPALAGAVLTLRNPGTGESATFTLPSSGWRRIGEGLPGPQGYTYSDRGGANGPCHYVSVRRGRRFKAACSGATGDIPFTLDEPSQGALAVTLQLGDANTFCMSFGRARDRSSGVTDILLVINYVDTHTSIRPVTSASLPPGSIPARLTPVRSPTRSLLSDLLDRSPVLQGSKEGTDQQRRRTRQGR